MDVQELIILIIPRTSTDLIMGHKSAGTTCEYPLWKSITDSYTLIKAGQQLPVPDMNTSPLEYKSIQVPSPMYSYLHLYYQLHGVLWLQSQSLLIASTHLRFLIRLTAQYLSSGWVLQHVGNIIIIHIVFPFFLLMTSIMSLCVLKATYSMIYPEWLIQQYDIVPMLFKGRCINIF